MQTLMDYGISFIIAFQSVGDWLTPIMRFFSQLGTEEFFFIALPLIYWCIDSTLGIQIGFILTVNNFFNTILKVAFALPRPYWVSSHVRALWTETTFGLPSGHAQYAMSIWGIVAANRKKIWITIVCVFLILMIGISRLYLGSHFPQDVLAGWLLGGIFLWAFVRYWDSAALWLSGKTFAQQTGIAFLVSILFVIVGMLVMTLRSGFQLPESWINNALLSDALPVPVDPNSIFTAAGTFFGLALGLAWIRTLGGFQPQGPAGKRALSYVIGLIGVLILWQGLGLVFPRGDGALVYSLRFVRYALVGWWVSGGAPWIFKHFNLTTSAVG